jgi:hypothetical protein
MFMNFVQDYTGSAGGFANNPAGQARYDYMLTRMSAWVSMAMQR